MPTGSGALNGFDLDVIDTLKGCIRRDPEQAAPTYAASIRWLGGQRTVATLANGTKLWADEPTKCAGAGWAPTSEDFLLSAVGSCVAAAWVGALTTHGISIDTLDVQVSGRVNFAGAYLLDGTPPGFSSIRIDVHLEADADTKVLHGLIQEVLRMSIVPDTIRRPVPVEMHLATSPGSATSE